MEADELILTICELGLSNPIFGDQEYVSAPKALTSTAFPPQITISSGPKDN